jgi:hypothetical protein
MILPATRELVRISLLRYAAAGGPRGVTSSLLMQYVRVEFRKEFSADDLQAEIQYLVDKDMLAPVGKTLSPELTIWRVTATGRDYLAQEGLDEP